MTETLTNGDEILFRQIHPQFIQGGVPASNRFQPSQKDNNKLSTDRSSLTTPKKSHDLYVSGGLVSAAVFGVSVQEFQTHDIECSADPLPETADRKANPAHALADYSQHDTKNQKLVAKQLQQLAIARGCLFPPSD